MTDGSGNFLDLNLNYHSIIFTASLMEISLYLEINLFSFICDMISNKEKNCLYFNYLCIFLDLIHYLQKLVIIDETLHSLITIERK